MMESTASGILLVDKEGGWTSHDVVAKARGIFRTRRVGHAGTLDPMATGLVILGVGAATRLLGYLSDAGKTYDATIVLGVSTNTDDGEGEELSRAADDLLEAITDQMILTGVSNLTGVIMQRPSNFSAIKIDGVRSYTRARSGEEFELPARQVTVSNFEVKGIRRTHASIEVDASVLCSSGTYIRALARDLGQALKVGGHLNALRRTSIGGFDVADAVKIGSQDLTLSPMGSIADRVMEVRRVNFDEIEFLKHGRDISASGRDGTVAALSSSNRLVALMQDRGDVAKPIAVFLEEM